MAVASTNSVALYLNPEATWGETPASPAMQQMRFTGESLAFAKQTAVSETIRSDRMRDQIALTSWETSGDMNYELEFFEYDELISGAMFANWTGILTVSGTNIAATSTTITDAGNRLADIPVNAYVWASGFTNSANNRRYRVTAAVAGAITLSPAPATTESAGANVTLSFGATSVTTNTTILTATVTASGNQVVTFAGSGGWNPTTKTNLVVGQWVNVQGFANAANNGIKRVTAITTTAITFAQTGAAETVTTGTVLKFASRVLRNGTTARSFHVQKSFTDISQHMSMRGMMVSDMKWDVSSGEVIKGTVSLMGKQVVRAGTTAAGSVIATNTTKMMTASGNVGTILQNGAAIAVGVKSISLEVANNLRDVRQVGSLYPYFLGYGFQDVTGSVEVYFENASMYDQLINHTATELSFPITDDDGNSYVVTLPAILLTEGYPDAGGGNDDVTIPFSFQAIRSATYNCQIQIDALPSFT